MTDQKPWLKTWLRRVRSAYKQRRWARQDGFLVVLGIMKNEALILQEWIDHYLWQGADKIILIDNGSSDNSMDIAQANERGGKVECISRPQKHRQEEHYRDAIRAFDLRKKYEWLLIADLDEFWFCKDGSLVGEVLREETYARVNLIYVNWTMFGSGGFVQQPVSVREAFVMRRHEMHDCTKWICRLPHLRRVKNILIHNVSGYDSARVVPGHNRFQLNHYAIQSRAYFEKVKMTRGDVNALSQ